jgi:hypothetical protein
VEDLPRTYMGIHLHLLMQATDGESDHTGRRKKRPPRALRQACTMLAVPAVATTPSPKQLRAKRHYGGRCNSVGAEVEDGGQRCNPSVRGFGRGRGRGRGHGRGTREDNAPSIASPPSGSLLPNVDVQLHPGEFTPPLTRAKGTWRVSPRQRIVTQLFPSGNLVPDAGSVV